MNQFKNNLFNKKQLFEVDNNQFKNSELEGQGEIANYESNWVTKKLNFGKRPHDFVEESDPLLKR